MSDAPTLQSCIEESEQRFEQADLFFGHGTDNAYDEAYWAVAHAAGLDVGDELNLELRLSNDQLAAMEKLVSERIKSRKPLAYLINEAWFAGERFYVDERVIVPRSHFGEFVPERFYPWIETDDVKNILELCTGSGCIAVALAQSFPEASVTATDLSAEALEVARINVDKHDLQERVELLQGDMFEALPNEGSGDNKYDLIVCNPPYVSDEIMQTLPDEYGFEPDMAFRAQQRGVAIIAQMLTRASDHLTPGGYLIVEAGSAVQSVEAAYPSTPFVWLTSENGDSVVFMLPYSELLKLK